MARSINAYIRAYQHVVSNFHPGAIQNDQIEIGVNAVPQADVGTVVAPERGLQIAPLPNASQEFAGRFPAQFIILRVRTVITGRQPAGPEAPRGQFRIAGVVQTPGEHIIQLV